MKKPYSYNRIYQIAIAAVLFLAIGMLGVFWVVEEYKHHAQAMESVRNDYIAERKIEVKTLINDLVESVEYQKNGVEEHLREDLSQYAEIGWTIANTIYSNSRGQYTEQEIKQRIIAALMPVRFFEGRGYYWVHNTEHNLIAHPYRQKSIGKDDADLTDSNGQKIIRSFVQTAKENPEGGFVSYYWNKPDVDEKYHKEKGQKKIAYLKLFAPYQWVIGVGEYVDNAEEKIQQKVIKRIASIRQGTKGYVFVHTRDGVCLNHVKKENIGKNRWELLDANGMKLVQELDRTGRRPGGDFLEYVGTINPDTGKPAKKISYVQSIEDWGWVLGSGVYSADIEKKIFEYRQELFGELRKKIATTLFLLLVVLIVGFLISRKLFQGLLKELNLFIAGSRDEKAKFIDLDQFRILELRTIASRANILLEEKEQAHADLNRAKRMESIGLMAGGVAHDLNNILSGIVGYPEVLLLTIPKDSELRRPIEAIRESGKRAATVVEDLLTVARGVASIREVHNLHVLIHEYLASPECERIKSLYPSITCEHKFTAAHPNILCSPVHIKKCLMNLVSNATEAIVDDGSIIISTKNDTVNSSNSIEFGLPEGDYVVVSVQDTGPGISDTDLEHIFEPFYTQKAMGRSGTGLGLTVVWNTLDDHGGKIFVESSAENTCFKLYFPVSRDKETVETKSDRLEKLFGNNEHILVVDDEPQLRDIASQMLQVLGYSVASVSSGEMAIDYIKEKTVDLIVIDMLMGSGINGRQTYEKILEINPKQRAIITSGFSESDDVKVALQLGACRFIKKPYSMDQLGQAVKEALKNKE